MPSPLVVEATERSLGLLARAANSNGFVASPSFEHYSVIWARDGAISSLGALVSGRTELVDAAVRTMFALERTASALGQIAAVARSDGGEDWGEGGVVDATAWYVILVSAVLETTGDTHLVAQQWPTVSSAISWLRCQDVTGSGLISAAPSTDWMDSSLVRSGRTLNLNVLYAWAARSAEKIALAIGERVPVEAQDLSWRVNTLFWPSKDSGPEELVGAHAQSSTSGRFSHPATASAYESAANRERSHYVSHVIHSDYEEHCDVLANLLTVCTGIANGSRANVILDHLAAEGVNEPYPSRVWVEPVDISEPSSMFLPGVETHLDARWHNPPHSYHNGAVWPFVGGFHVAALALSGRRTQADDLLESLALANKTGEWGFHEWLHGETGEPRGARDQTWNAGTFVLAGKAIEDSRRVEGLFR